MVGLSRPSGNMGQTYEDTDELQLQELKANTIARLVTGERFAVLTTDGGSGLVLANGNFANPLSTVDPQTATNTGNISTNADAIFPVDIATATNLVVGKNYLSTATATHTVPTGVDVGDEIGITWLDGTVMTLTSAFNISVTKDVKITDTTWVFTNFIADLTLVWNGTEWEIK